MSDYPNWTDDLESEKSKPVCPECFTILSKTGKCACPEK